MRPLNGTEEELSEWWFSGQEVIAGQPCSNRDGGEENDLIDSLLNPCCRGGRGFDWVAEGKGRLLK